MLKLLSTIRIEEDLGVVDFSPSNTACGTGETGTNEDGKLGYYWVLIGQQTGRLCLISN